MLKHWRFCTAELYKNQNSVKGMCANKDSKRETEQVYMNDLHRLRRVKYLADKIAAP